MIKTIHIENFAIIDQLTIDFSPGFLVFSGETGAGKSILITALNLLLGGRAFTEYIQSGKENAKVEGVFKIHKNSSVLNFMEERGFDLLDDQEILIKRKIYRTEKSNRCYINHQPCPLSLLSEMGKWLVDIHGQHEHQFLLIPERHIDLLDAFGNLKELREQFTDLYEKYKKKCDQLHSLFQKKQTDEKERELLQFQMLEIDQANLKPGEEQEIEVRKRQLQNAEKLFQESTIAAQELYETEGAVHEQLSKIAGRLKQLSKIDDFFSPLADSLNNSSYLIEDIASQCRVYSQEIKSDPHLLDECETRSIEIQKLKRKYGDSIEQILEQRTKMEKKWQSMREAKDEIEQLQKKIRHLNEKAIISADKLSLERKKTASSIERQIKKELEDLHMPKAQFKVAQRKKKSEPSESSMAMGHSLLPSFPYKTTAKGIDIIEFLFSANQGEELKALSRIASGGEISRIMLALKTLLRAADEIPALVFDELDIGIGGDISKIVGKKLKALAGKKQILCITHSPQIASMADHHYVVKKVINKNRTNTLVEKLKTGQRIEELSRMLGGGSLDSTITIKHAQELMKLHTNSSTYPQQRL